MPVLKVPSNRIPVMFNGPPPLHPFLGIAMARAMITSDLKITMQQGHPADRLVGVTM